MKSSKRNGDDDDAPARWSCCATCCWYYIVFSLYLGIGVLVKVKGVWHETFELDQNCEHPELPANQTGVKVLIAGFAKSGTRTISHALNALGVRTYHSEDIDQFSWREYAYNLRTKYPEYKNLGQGEVGAVLYFDQRAVKELTSAVSRCHCEGIAMDGMERLFWPTYKVSPGAKVILLDWRSFHEWRKSIYTYSLKLAIMCMYGFWVNTPYFIPWNALNAWMPRYFGDPIRRVLKNGGPPVTEVSGPTVFNYVSYFIHFNHMRTWFPVGPLGVMDHPETEVYYQDWLQAVRDKVPKEDLMSFNPKKHTYNDLCEFLDISPCPMQGNIRKAKNTFLWERDFPLSSIVGNFCCYWLHWVNMRLIMSGLSWLSRRLRRCRRRLKEKRA